jgi:hypothetical protein
MMRIFDGLEGAAAQVVSHLGGTLKQTRPAVALLGDESSHTGLAPASNCQDPRFQRTRRRL